jgi:hypothetical protein
VPDLYKKAMEDENGQYAGVARIIRAYGMMLMTDLYGEMPYFAVEQESALPEYNTGREIFMQCIADVDEGISLLEGAQTLDPTKPALAEGDFWNNGDVNKWIKLGYLLKARWLHKLTKKAAGSYKDGKYDFAALLPKEGITVDELVAGLDGEELNRILTGRKDTTVYTAIPKFETDFDIEMSGVLKTMGMPLAFDPEKADFKALGESEEGNISISRVIHKTFMSVGEQGTKAGAATLVEMVDEAILLEEEPKEVLLNRPFVYMLVDCETWTPFFIGTMMHVNEE